MTSEKGILNKWWQSQSKGDIDEFDVGYVKIYPTEFEELKELITREIDNRIEKWNNFIKVMKIKKPSIRNSRIQIIIDDLEKLKSNLIGEIFKGGI